MSASEFVTDLRRRGRDSRPVSRVVRAGRASAASVQRQYSSDQPLRGYVTLIGVYVAAGAVAVWASGRGKAADRSISTGDLVRITIAAHRLSRTLTKETIASPLRAPFTRLNGSGIASELNEQVRPSGHDRPVAHAVGELLTCPFCMAQWAATALVTAHLLVPRQARLVTAILDAAAGADALHYGYVALDRLDGQAPGPGPLVRSRPGSLVPGPAPPGSAPPAPHVPGDGGVQPISPGGRRRRR